MSQVGKFAATAFRELIPITERQTIINSADVFARYLDAITALQSAGPDTNCDPTLLSSSQRLFDSEAARQASINSRASGLMAAIGLAAALVTGIGLTTFKDAAALPSLAFYTVFGVYVVVLLYLAATTVIAFQVQGYIPRSTLDPSDLSPTSGDKYVRTVACKILHYTVDNYKINNIAVNLLYSGMKCFRNALLVLVIGGLAVASMTLSFQRSGRTLPGLRRRWPAPQVVATCRR